jgi:hypothetical protein
VGLTQFTCSPFQLKVLQFLELSNFIKIILILFSNYSIIIYSHLTHSFFGRIFKSLLTKIQFWQY